MPSLARHQSNSLTKLLLVGDAKSGKTGSLVSLVKAGYKLRILDFDNLLDVLKYMIIRECPESGSIEMKKEIVMSKSAQNDRAGNKKALMGAEDVQGPVNYEFDFNEIVYFLYGAIGAFRC